MSKNVNFLTFTTYYIIVLIRVLLGGVGTCTMKTVAIIIAIMIIAQKEKINVA